MNGNASFNRAIAPTKPDLGQGLGYDPAMILVDTLRRLPGNASAKDVRDALLDTHGYVGINGVYDFHSGDNRGLGVGNAVLVQLAIDEDWLTEPKRSKRPVPVVEMMQLSEFSDVVE